MPGERSHMRWWIWSGVAVLALAIGWSAYQSVLLVDREERIAHRVILLHLPEDLTGRIEIRQSTADDDPQLISGFARGENPRWYDIHVMADGVAVVDNVDVFRMLQRLDWREGAWSLRAVDASGQRLPCCFASWQPHDQVAFRLYSTKANGTRVVLVGPRAFMGEHWPRESAVAREMFWADKGAWR